MGGPPPRPRAARCRRHAARRSLLALLALLAAAAALLPRAAAAPSSSSSRAHRHAHASHVRGKKHAASRRARHASGALLSGDTLLEATAGMCNFMETEPFEEYFQKDLNATRWDLSSMSGLFHCNRGTDEYVRASGARGAGALRARAAARPRCGPRGAAHGRLLRAAARPPGLRRPGCGLCAAAAPLASLERSAPWRRATTSRWARRCRSTRSAT